MIAGKQVPEKAPSKAAKQAQPASRKRKAAGQSRARVSKRRRKVGDSGIQVMPPVQLLPVAELRPAPRKDASVQDISKLRSVTMPSWKDLLRGAGASLMDKVAAEPATEHVLSPAAPEKELSVDEGMEGLDAEAIQMALRGNLESLGLDLSAVDQGSLLALVKSMMARDADADVLLGDFIERLVPDDEDDEDAQEDAAVDNAGRNGNVFGKWVSDRAHDSAKQKEPLAVHLEVKTLQPSDADVEDEGGEMAAPRRSKRKQDGTVYAPKKRSRGDDGSVQA
jgi:hypothetical protein